MKFAIAIAAIFCLTTSFGQTNYRPIPETNATWIQAQFLYGGFHEHETVTSVVYTLEDTVINGQTYVKFGTHGFRKWIDGYGSPNQSTGGGPIPYDSGYFRQDIAQKKVFIWNAISQSESLLYDFGSLVIGQPYPETMTNLNYPNLLVMGKDSVQLIDGNYYQRWLLGTNSQDSAYTAVIEGVGGTHGFNTVIHPVFEQEGHLMCHKVETQHIYEDWQTSVILPEYSEDCSQTLSLSSFNEPTVTIYPNPSNSFFFIQSSQLVDYVEIFGMNGQSLLHYVNNVNIDMSFDASILEQGVYLVRIVLVDGNVTTQQIQVTQ